MEIFNLNGDRVGSHRGPRGLEEHGRLGRPPHRLRADRRSMYEVEPGNRHWPFHTHHANEEWVIVLRGGPALRAREGEQVLREGNVVAFPRGKEGAHQIRNDTDAPIRVLMLSTGGEGGARSRRTSSGTSTRAKSAPECGGRPDLVRPPGA